jgi:hypothetical protein
MLAIVVSACLVANPTECRDFALPLAVEKVDVLRCAMVAPTYFAQWASEHPEWQVKSWTCKAGVPKDI